MNYSLKLVGWREGLQKIQATKHIRDREGVSFSKAKACVDEILEDQIVLLPTLRDHSSVQEIKKSYEELGLVCEVLVKD